MNNKQNEDASRKPFNWRALTSFFVTLGFLILALTGTALYLSPQGRVAHWTAWRLAGLEKEQWSALHMAAGFLFIVAAAFHLYFNWGIFVSYIKKVKGLNLKKEMAIALVVAALLLAGTLLQWPPFHYVTQLNDAIKAHWNTRSAAGPYPHAEASTLADFAQRTGIPLEELQKRLGELGLSEFSESTTLADAARTLGLSPNALFQKLNAPAPERGAGNREGRGGAGMGSRQGSGQGSQSTSDNGAGRASGSGQGLGRQTIDELCRARGVDLQAALAALDTAGIPATANDRLRDIAERAQRTPSEILSLIEKTQ